jgi:hypothetical protein
MCLTVSVKTGWLGIRIMCLTVSVN